MVKMSESNAHSSWTFRHLQEKKKNIDNKLDSRVIKCAVGNLNGPEFGSRYRARFRIRIGEYSGNPEITD